MSSTILETLKTLGKNKHEVGTLANWTSEVINLGAIVTEADIDNYTLVELSFNEKGERVCKQLSAHSNKAYLIASPEEYMPEFGEGIANFYNAVNERARIVKLVEGKRFDTSAFSKDNTSKEIKNGQKAHFDIATKKFIISNDTTDNEGYTNAGAKFVVVEATGRSLDGKELVRFEIVEA